MDKYRPIMVGSLLAKLFRCIMESKISHWVEKSGKGAYGQVRFKNTIAPLINLSTLEYNWRKFALEIKVYIVAL